jgi:hypothetical protein
MGGSFPLVTYDAMFNTAIKGINISSVYINTYIYKYMYVYIYDNGDISDTSVSNSIWMVGGC